MDEWIPINEQPEKNGKYLVKFYNENMPEYDCTEIVWREFVNGEWLCPFYDHSGDGYELIAWKKENCYEY